MLYRFKSQATADVLMLEANARQLLELAGKPVGATGIITVAQIPDVLAKLEAAIAQEVKRHHQGGASGADGQQRDADQNHVALHQRAAPLVDMLKRSLEEDKDVIWGA